MFIMCVPSPLPTHEPCSCAAPFHAQCARSAPARTPSHRICQSRYRAQIHLKDGWHEVSVKLSEWVLTATHAQLNTRKDHFELVSSVSEFEDGEGNIKTMPFDSVLTSDEKEWKENKEYACSKLRI